MPPPFVQRLIFPLARAPRASAAATAAGGPPRLLNKLTGLVRTQYYCAASLDGYIAERDDTLEWLMKYQGSFAGEGAEPIRERLRPHFYDGVGALVMGSVTYEFILAHDGMEEWPYKGKPSWVLHLA